MPEISLIKRKNVHTDKKEHNTVLYALISSFNYSDLQVISSLQDYRTIKTVF